MKQAMGIGNGKVRWLEAVDNGLESKSPFYQVDWEIPHEVRFDIWDD